VPRYLWRTIADNGVEGPRTALRSGCFPRLAGSASTTPGGLLAFVAIAALYGLR
jgi:hypothetical protein